LSELLRVTHQAAAAAAVQTLPLGLPLLVLGLLIHLSSALLERESLKLFGTRGYLYLFGWIGTSVHELGHAVFCPLFGHSIDRMRLFSLDTRSRSAGFVYHSYNRRNLYHLVGNFFIGVGPLLLGTALIYLVLRYLAGFPLQPGQALSAARTLPSSDVAVEILGWPVFFLSSFKSLTAEVAGNIDFTDYRLYLAAYLVLSIGSSMTLSPEDIRSGWKGLATLLSLVFLVNLVLTATGIPTPNSTPVLGLAAAAAFLMLLSLAACWAGIGLIHALRILVRR